MRFHVIGVGSIGSLISHHLRNVIPPTSSISLIHKTAHDAAMSLRRDCKITVSRDGVSSESSGFQPEVFQAPSSFAARRLQSKWQRRKDAEELGPNKGALPEYQRPEGAEDNIQSLIVATKATSTLQAIRHLQPRLSSNSTIVLLQNGMGIYESLVDELFTNPMQRPHFILASNTHGVFQRAKYDVVHAGIGAIDFGLIPDHSGRDFEAGLLDETFPRLERQLRLNDITHPDTDPSFQRYQSLRSTVAALLLLKDPLNTSWSPIANVQTAMRRKLVVNAVINPLTAIMRCRNGQVFNTGGGRTIMSQVCREAACVFAAEAEAEANEHLDQLARRGIDPSQASIPRLPKELTAEYLEAECLRVAEATKGNISSMLADIEHGRKTEIEFINGYLLKLGKTYGVAMPSISMLRALVKMRLKTSLDVIL